MRLSRPVRDAITGPRGLDPDPAAPELMAASLMAAALMAASGRRGARVE
jgi:hypothetical protein